jgi:NAD(P)-dependent dehydrogenase (short-subunit alcohol dehydrogenase family)
LEQLARFRGGGHAAITQEGKSLRLKGKVAVVTGAGSGIGRAIAVRLASEGAQVAIAELEEATGEATAERIRGAGGNAVSIPTDVSRSDSVAALFTRLDALQWVPEILVNNAGNAAPSTPTHDVTDEAWDAIVRVHLNGTFYGTREALRRMLPRGRGVLINIGSVLGMRGLPGGAAYTAAKGAIAAFTKGLAREVAESGIRVNCIAPGWIETPILDNVDAGGRERLAKSIPMGRLGTPDEIATVAAFLASDEASYLTGQVISPNGGWYT